MVTASDFLTAAKRVSIREVEVEGLKLHVRGLTGGERRALRERALAENPMQAHELVGLAACTADGNPFFSPEQVAELERVDGALVEKIAEAIIEASGLLPKAVESAAKN